MYCFVASKWSSRTFAALFAAAVNHCSISSLRSVSGITAIGTNNSLCQNDIDFPPASIVLILGAAEYVHAISEPIGWKVLFTLLKALRKLLVGGSKWDSKFFNLRLVFWLTLNPFPGFVVHNLTARQTSCHAVSHGRSTLEGSNKCINSPCEGPTIVRFGLPSGEVGRSLCLSLVDAGRWT